MENTTTQASDLSAEQIRHIKVLGHPTATTNLHAALQMLATEMTADEIIGHLEGMHATQTGQANQTEAPRDREAMLAQMAQCTSVPLDAASASGDAR